VGAFRRRRSSCRGATISRLVALVPKPRANLTRFHGVFAPNSKYRSKVIPARRDKRKKCHSADEADRTPAEKRSSMAGFCSCKTGIHAILGNNLGTALEACFHQKRAPLGDIDIETCDKCGGDVRIMASIEDPIVIEKILTRLKNTASSAATAFHLPDCRAPPSLPAGLFD